MCLSHKADLDAIHSDCSVATRVHSHVRAGNLDSRGICRARHGFLIIEQERRLLCARGAEVCRRMNELNVRVHVFGQRVARRANDHVSVINMLPRMEFLKVTMSI